MAVDLSKYQDPGLPENTTGNYLRQLVALRESELEQMQAKRQREMAASQSAEMDPSSLFQNRTSEQSAGLSDSAQYKVLDTAYPITQQFGNYNPALYKGITKDSRHLGVDVATPSGTKVYAPIGGEVQFGYDKSWGNYALVKGSDGVTYRFSHLSSIDDLLKQASQASMSIKPGQVLGLTGSTGNSTGPHLDISTTRNGQYFNPLSISALERALAGK